jgi:hypothetical protein
MPLSRAINYAHPTASNFFENLIIPEKPIRIVVVNIAQYVIQGRLDRRMLAIRLNTCGQEALQTKAATYARYGPTFGAEARFSRKMQRKRTGRRTHAGESG